MICTEFIILQFIPVLDSAAAQGIFFWGGGGGAIEVQTNFFWGGRIKRRKRILFCLTEILIVT